MFTSIHVIIHLDNRNKSCVISEALGDDFRAKSWQKSTFYKAELSVQNSGQWKVVDAGNVDIM